MCSMCDVWHPGGHGHVACGMQYAVGCGWDVGCGMWDVGGGQCRGLMLIYSCVVVQQGSFLIEIHALSIYTAASCYSC
jgi:hypothetical protein